jgi:hypothetical protein
MPVPYLKKLADKHGVSLGVAEKRWEKAKTLAAEQGHADNYAYITGIAKKMFNEDYPGIAKLIRDLIEDIRNGKVDADEAARILAETVTSGSVGGFIAGGLVQGYKGTPFPTGTRDRNGIPNMPPWGNAAEMKSASNLPGRKRHKRKHKKHRRVHESESPREVYAYHAGAADYHWKQGNRDAAKKHRKAAEATGVRPSTYTPGFASREMDAATDAATQKGWADAAAGKAVTESGGGPTQAEKDSFAFGYHREAREYLRAYFPKDIPEEKILKLHGRDEMKAHLLAHEHFTPLARQAANAHGKGFSTEAMIAGREAHRDIYKTTTKYAGVLRDVMAKVEAHAGCPAR